MATPYQRIYNSFFTKVSDDVFLAMDEEELQEELFALMESALPLFLYPDVDLEDRDDTLQQFNETLRFVEIDIISEAMRVKWQERQINDIKLFEQQFTTNDFNLGTQAFHMRALQDTAKETKKTLRDLQHAYTKVKDRAPDFDGLAGR